MALLVVSGFYLVLPSFFRGGVEKVLPQKWESSRNLAEVGVVRLPK